MIRFSAALVAVAIGVLIGGIATDKLLLVYIAIVVSAVALVALAIGVMLKREELLGERQGLVPAAAGAGPVPLVRFGERQVKASPSVPVAPPPGAGAELSAARPAEAGQGRSADRGSPWATPGARDPRASPALDPRPAWMPAGPDTSPGSSTSGGRADALDVPNADAQAATTAARSWAAPPSSTVSTDTPAVKPGTGSGSTPPPSWFDRLGRSVGADAPASTSTPAPGAGSGWSWSSGDSTAPAATTASDSGDSGDEWPTRYSWLDDETDESDAANEVAGGADAADGASAEPESESPASAGTSSDLSSAAATQDIAAPKASAPADAGTSEHVAAAADTDVAAVAVPDPESDVAAEAESESDAEDTGEAASEPSAEGPADAAPEAGLVAVVHGVPRYHEPDCVLIRFMPEGDAQRRSIAEAREAGCTPCSVCQPGG